MILIHALLLLNFALLPPPSSWEYKVPSEKEIIRAFLDSPDIIAAREELGREFHEGEITTVSYQHHGGYAGSQSSVLVIQKFERRKADPVSRCILGLVHMKTVGPTRREIRITGVERVVLVPYMEWERMQEMSTQPGMPPIPVPDTRDNWKKLERGMTRADVRHILGEPDDIPLNSYLEIWDYSKTYGGSSSVTFDENGRVESWIGPF